jgi:cytochrome c553
MTARILIAVALLTLSATSRAGEFDAAKFLADSCSRCHDSSVYTREDRRVQSLDALHSQVRRCDAMLGTKLYEEDIDTLVGHLNSQYYHF